ncbi:MAG: YciI family protein [Rhodospirillales bacterium]
MLFTIFCIDKPGMAEKRNAVMDAHRDYLSQSSIKLVMSGPLVDDDGEAVVGSLYVVEAENRAEVEAFQKDDPLVAADLWETVEVRGFLKRVDNRD